MRSIRYVLIVSETRNVGKSRCLKFVSWFFSEQDVDACESLFRIYSVMLAAAETRKSYLVHRQLSSSSSCTRLFRVD